MGDKLSGHLRLAATVWGCMSDVSACTLALMTKLSLPPLGG